ncbi:uncharacterized protein LOC142619204 [Castanea sativa]|uniref:uncharacterized protein LOC142619204 n=1 Tax=Castanea sativa TaxID=21020 RepID=UPI003F650465
MNQSYEVMLTTTTPLCKRNHKTTVLITKSFNNLDIVLFSKRIGLMNMEKATLWTTPYFDFKISEGKFERIRELYEKLLDKLKHLKGHQLNAESNTGESIFKTKNHVS